MIGKSYLANQLGWENLLKLGEQLINEVNPVNQRRLILDTLDQLIGGKTKLWLAETLHTLPGFVQNGKPISDPLEGIMKEAAESGQQRSGTSSEPSSVAPPHIIALPLINQGLLMGVLQIDRTEGDGFAPVEINFMRGLAAQAAIAIQVSRQIAIKNWRFEQLALVRSVSAQIANVMDIDELSRRVTNLILQTFQYYYVAIFTLEPGAQTLKFCASAGPGNSQITPEPVLDLAPKIGDGLVGHAAQSGIEILASNVELDPRYCYIDKLPATKSEIAIPLKIENRVLGVLDIQSDLIDAFHEIDVMVLQALADNIALAVEGARLYSNLRLRADQITTVAEVAKAITSILDLETMLSEVVILIQKRFGFPFVHVFTVHPGRRKIIYQTGTGARSKALQAMEMAYELDDSVGIIPWVARNGQMLVANDVSKEPRYRPSELPPDNTEAEVAVPLLFGKEVLGVLDLQSDHLNAFSDNDLFIFQALADNIAIAVRNAMLYRSEHWRRQVSESLRDIAGLLSSEVGFNQVLNAILGELNRNLPCDIAAFWLLDDEFYSPNTPLEDMHVHLAAVFGVDFDQLSSVLEQHPETQRMLLESLKNNQPTIRLADSPLGPLGTAMEYPQDYSSIAAPLRSGDQPFGLLTLAHHTPGRYGLESKTITAAFASYAAIAIENNHLFASAQEQAWVSTVMLQVAEATQSISSIDELLATVVRLTPLLVGVKGCALFLWDPLSESFILNAAYGISPAQQANFAQYPITPGAIPAFDQLRFGKLPILIQDANQELKLPDDFSLLKTLNSFVLYPMLARGEILGAFMVEHHPTDSQSQDFIPINDQRHAIIQGITQQTTIAVENIRLLEAKQEEAYVTAVLLQVAQAVVSTNELNDILDTIVHLMPILVGIDCSIIFLWNETNEVFRPTQIYGGCWKSGLDSLKDLYTPGEFPILDEVRESDQTVIIPMEGNTPSIESWQNIHPSSDYIENKKYLTEKADLLMAFPLSVKGKLFGVLFAIESNSSKNFRERRLEIITGIAQQTALAIQNDLFQRETVERERLEREFQLAHEIQQSFLPSELPPLPGWDLDVRWRPAHQVGGDFYDIFELPNHKIGLVIADVSDKGMPAALYMTVTRTLIRAAAKEIESPAAALMRVNDLLLADSQNGMFITTIYAQLSLKTGKLVYSNAGHNIPLLLRSSSGDMDRLAKGGIALGALENIKLKDHTITLKPEDSLLFYTDGVTEAFSPDGDIFGEDRLVNTICKLNGSTARQILDAIDTAVIRFQGSLPQSDDVTLLALRRLSHSSAESPEDSIS